MLTLTRPLVSIDIESTGLDPVDDRIIQFGVCVLHPDGHRTTWSQNFNPGIAISAGATAVHGITDEMVKDCPPFADFAAVIWKGLQGKDLLTYNGRSLDLPMLDEELRRCGLKLDLDSQTCPSCKGNSKDGEWCCPECRGIGVITVNVLDSYSIICNREPRDLAASVKRFCGRDHTEAHGALADAEATLDVLLAQRQQYGVLEINELVQLSTRGEPTVDIAGKLYRDADGDMRFNFGQKQRGVKVREDVGFAYWVLGKNFPGSTKEVLRSELERIGG